MIMFKNSYFDVLLENALSIFKKIDFEFLS